MRPDLLSRIACLSRRIIRFGMTLERSRIFQSFSRLDCCNKVDVYLRSRLTSQVLVARFSVASVKEVLNRFQAQS